MKNQSDKGKLLSKVAKLLRKTEAAGCTEGEALAALSKARELLDARGLSMADVAALEAGDSGGLAEALGLDTRELWSKAAGGVYAWEKVLMAAVKTLCDLELMWMQGRRASKWGPAQRERFVFVGAAADLRDAEAAIAFLMRAAKRLARQDCGSGWTTAHRSHARGFADVVAARCKEAKRESQQCATTALMVRSKAALVAEKARKDLGRGKHSKIGGSRVDPVAYAAGKMRGTFTNLGTEQKVR